MSSGILVCNQCMREVHQNTRMQSNTPSGWHHCNDKSDMCYGASTMYPDSIEQINGPYCGRDATPDEQRQRTEKRGETRR